jgi:long-chain fatty acid transport protein
MVKKKILFCTAVLLLSAGILFAGNLDYLSNQSVEWLQTLNRNGATDAADIINYNPAGTVFLPKGLHINLSNQTLFKLYSHSMTENPNNTSPPRKSFDADMMTWFLPNLYVSYNFGNVGIGKLALNLQAGVTAGGGNLEYDNGTAGSTFGLGILSGAGAGAITSQSFSASSIYYGIGAGGAYSFFDDMLSLSLGGRMVIARRSFAMEGEFSSGMTAEADYDYNALGFTPIIGLDIRPIDKLTIGLRYEYETRLKFEYEENTLSVSNPALDPVITAIMSNQGIWDGRTFFNNLPQIIALGIEYEFFPGFALDMSGNLYLLPWADLDGNEKYFDIGYDIGLGARWQILEALKLGAGFSYTESGATARYFKEKVLFATANPPLDSIAVGLGGTYSFPFGLDLNLGLLYSHYIPVKYNAASSVPAPVNVKGTAKKDVIEVGLGIAYHY